MITVKWTGKGEGSREFRNEKVASNFAAGLKRTGYQVEVINSEVAKQAEIVTGRIGKKGLEVHEIKAGVAKCGASYRARRLGGTLVTKVTGEEVTCRRCH